MIFDYIVNLYRKSILRIIEDERRGIGCDLHDYIGPNITSISFMIEALKKNCKKKSSKEFYYLNNISEELSRTIKIIQLFVRGLSPIFIEKYEFLQIFEAFTSNISNITGIECSIEHEVDLSEIDNSTVNQLFLIAQEAVYNAIKHTETDKILISLNEDHKELYMIIENNIIELKDKNNMNAGIGLKSMNYRAKLINANIKILNENDVFTVIVKKRKRT